ncbi:MAG TPA: hypothetical protein VFC78_07090 [Tepidisphaeraceae bacterium]|nr:hypothetical protein [Tepidisphaeraceae bacterium]
MPLSTLPPARVLSEPVSDYCARHELLSSLQAAIRLAENNFSPILGLDVTVENDPEADADYLVIDVSVALSVEDVVARKREFTNQWVRNTPASLRERIRLVYNIV